MVTLLKELRDQFEIAAHPRNAGTVRERVRALASQAGFSGVDLADIEIAVGEAVTNAILYGSPTAASRIGITSFLHGASFQVEIHDQGHGFDPNQLQEDVDNHSLGGRGIHLMRALMDDVELHHNGHGMIARLSKNLSL